MRLLRRSFTVVLTCLTACGSQIDGNPPPPAPTNDPGTAGAVPQNTGDPGNGDAQNPSSPPPNQDTPSLADTAERIGDSTVSYMNPEFTSDGRYMVWFEPGSTTADDGRLYGTVWHCAVDSATGDLDPPDGRGFAAFPATIWTRANTGAASGGVFYVGQYASPSDDPNNDHLVVVRPSGPMTGQVVVVSNSLPTTQRRSIFPTAIADRTILEQYVWWLENDVGYSPTAADSVTLKYISLSQPWVENIVTTQEAPGVRWSPMDTTYVRLVEGTPILTLGVPTDYGIEVATFNLDEPYVDLSQVTDDGAIKLDPWSFVRDGVWYFLAGIAGTDTSALYAANDYRGAFSQVETITPIAAASGIADAARCQPQSHQTFELHGKLYSSFQISDCTTSRNFQVNPGEIWLAEVTGDGTPDAPIRISPDGRATNNEPEPVVSDGKAWVFYTSYPADLPSPALATFELWRVTLR